MSRADSTVPLLQSRKPLESSPTTEIISGRSGPPLRANNLPDHPSFPLPHLVSVTVPSPPPPPTSERTGQLYAVRDDDIVKESVDTAAGRF